MPRSWPETHQTSGKIVGFKLRPSRTGSTYFVFFNGPDGHRREISTNCTGLEKARAAARQIIDEMYAMPSPDAPKSVSWAEAEVKLKARLTAAGLRSASVKYYLRVLGYLKTFCTEASGPGDVTPVRAQNWADHYATAPARRKKGGSDPNSVSLRSGHTAVSVIEAVAAIFQKWLLDDLKITSMNPFAHVKPPKTDKPEIMIASDAVLANFDKWLTERFGDWQLPKLFFAIKELTGCRVQDVCSLKSGQLRAERVHFPANSTKGRKARAVPLPDDLFAALDAIKGPTYLWESYPVGLKAVLERKSWPTHQLKLDFNPMRMVGWIMTIFADYNADHPNAPRLKSHQLRKRAFTASWEKKIDPRKAAIAIGCNVDTMMKHYVALDEQATTDEVFAALTPTLRRPHSHTTTGQNEAGGLNGDTTSDGSEAEG